MKKDKYYIEPENRVIMNEIYTREELVEMTEKELERRRLENYREVACDIEEF